MNEDLEKKRNEAIADLRILARRAPSRLLYSEFRGLAGIVLDRLGVRGDVSRSCRAAFLEWLVPRFVDNVREVALRRLIVHAPRRGLPIFQAAAATELLKVRPASFGDQYERLRKVRRREKPTDTESSRGPGDRYAAAVWLGLTRKAVNSENDDELYLAFVAEMEGYLLDTQVQQELLALINQQALTAAHLQSAASTVQASTTAKVKYPRPVTPDVQGILIELAERVWRRLHDEHAATHVGRAAMPLPRRLVQDELYVDDPRNVADAWGAGPSDSRWESVIVDDLAQLVSSAPCARLVVLGQGGAGKTTLAASMALKILESADRPESSPVPVIFQLSFWNPHRQPDLSEWLVERLIAEDRSLKQAAKGKVSWAKRLVDGGYVMPILDGFDEIDALVQPAALRAINSWVERGNSVVLLSRGREYFHAVAANRPLVGATVVEIQNAELDAVEEYLGRTTLRGEEWTAVFAQVRVYPERDRSVLLHSVLTTPLMAMLAGAVYDNTDGRESEDQRSPMELLDAERFPSAHALTEYLLDAFIRVRLDPRFETDDGRRGKTWHHDDARKWLGFLAAGLVVGETGELRWWKPGGVFDAGLEKVGGFVGLGAIAGGIVAYASADSFRQAMQHPGGLFVASFFASVMFWFVASQQGPRTMAWRFGSRRRDQWRAPSTSEEFMTSFIVPLLGVLMVSAALRSFIAAVLTLAILAAVYYSTPLAHVEREAPVSLLRADRTVALMRGGSLSALVTVWCLVAWMTTGRVEYLESMLLTAFGFGVVVLCTASTLWTLRTGSLAASGRLPWRTMRFLDDVHKRGILRQSGGSYQFRHGALQGHLARDQVNSLPGQWAFMSPDRARSLLMMSNFRSGVYDQVDDELRKLIAEDDNSGIAGAANAKRLLLVEVLREKGQLLEAVEQLRKYESSKFEVRYGRHLENQLLLVELLWRLGDETGVQDEGQKLLREIEKQNHWYKGVAREKAWVMMARLREHPLFSYDNEAQ